MSGARRSHLQGAATRSRGRHPRARPCSRPSCVSTSTSSPVVRWRLDQAPESKRPSAQRLVARLQTDPARPPAACPGRWAGRRTARAGWSSMPASSAGEVGRRPVGVDADADDRALDPVIVEAASPSTPATLRSQPSAPSATMSLGHFKPSAPSRRPATSSAASSIASATVAPSRHAWPAGRSMGRNPAETSSAAPGGAIQVRPRRPRPWVCSSATAMQTSGYTGIQPAAHDGLRRRDAAEALQTAEEALGHAGTIPGAVRGRRSRASRCRTPRAAGGPAPGWTLSRPRLGMLSR